MPGLLRGVARTAVITGTATAVSGRVQRRQAAKYADRDAQTAVRRASLRQPGLQQAHLPGPQQRELAQDDMLGTAQEAGRAEGQRRPHGGGVRHPEGQDPRRLTCFGRPTSAGCWSCPAAGGRRSAAGSAGCPRRCPGSWSRGPTSPAARLGVADGAGSSTQRRVMSVPTRPALALAIEASIEFGLRLSAIHADCRVSRYAASQSASSWRNVAAAADWFRAGRS